MGKAVLSPRNSPGVHHQCVVDPKSARKPRPPYPEIGGQLRLCVPGESRRGRRRRRDHMNDEPIQPGCEREHDFALIVQGVPALTTEAEDTLHKAGCDDATLTVRYGLLLMEFSRSAPSIQEAIISAIHDVESAGIGAQVVRVDDCNLVTMADIARRIGRSRQMVWQYIMGARGPGGFPPPVCFVTEHRALWAWCEVSHWLAQNNVLRPERHWDAEVVAAINNALEMAHQRARHPELVNGVNRELNLL